MNLGLKDRAVFISGASGGIGRAVASVLAEEGAQLVLHGNRQAEDLSRWLAQQSWRDQASIARADVRGRGRRTRDLAATKSFQSRTA